MGFFKKLLIPPGMPLVPSFAEASKPDATWTIAGLKFGAHSDGLPFGHVNYFTVSRQDEVSAVPEMSTAAMLGVGVVLVLVAVMRGRA